LFCNLFIERPSYNYNNWYEVCEQQGLSC